MSIRSTLLAAPFLAATLGLAHADELKPARAQSINLGDVLGNAYYTVERDGFRVVTTLSEEAGTPVRMIAVLAPGQSVILSTPREVGVAPVEVEISRKADTVLIRRAAVPTN
ncbi:MAG: hypothetical protein AB7S41_09310 [Parvibaculaceae bacterium]